MREEYKERKKRFGCRYSGSCAQSNYGSSIECVEGFRECGLYQRLEITNEKENLNYLDLDGIANLVEEKVVKVW